MYHAEQDRKKMFTEYPDNEIVMRREIDAQNYLLERSEKYKIPAEEVEITKHNLKEYEERLKRILQNNRGV